MSEGVISTRKAIQLIVVAWVLSLITTLAVVYLAPFVPIGTNKIGDSAVTSDKIAPVAVITTKLADGSITSAKIVDGTIIAQDLADNSIISVKVEDGAITAAKIADSSVTATKIADSAIVTVKLADSAVAASKIADTAISAAKLGDGAVTTAKLADNAIITVKLSDGSVTSAKILDGTITAVDLADGSITTTKIADGAITSEKIADGAVTTVKIADGSITVEKIADGAIALALFNGNAILFETDFESIDGYATATKGAASSVILGAGEVQLTAGALTGDYATLSFMHDNYLMGRHSTFDTNKRFRTIVQIVGRTSQTIYVTYGEAMEGVETSPHFGFKIVNARIYGSVANGTTQSLTSSALHTITDDFVEFEACFYAGNRVEFYINGVYRGVLTTNLPSGTEVNYIPLNLSITVDANAIRTMNVARWSTLQEA